MPVKICIAQLRIGERGRMDKSTKKKCHAVIHSSSASAAGVGGGLAQIPGSDSPILVGIQTAMIISLEKIFNRTITESLAGAFLADTLGTTIGRGISQLLVGWIPCVGNAINATTAAGLTEAIGWAAAKAFDKGEL